MCSPLPGPPIHSSASTSYLPPTGRFSGNYEPSTSFPTNIYFSHSQSNEHVPISHPQRPRATTPSHPPSTPQYTRGFPAIPSPENPPVPRLRPASWGSLPEVNCPYGGRPLKRARSSTDLLGYSSSEDEELSFGKRTLPPPLTSSDRWSLGTYTTSNASATSSRLPTPDNFDFPIHYPASAPPYLTNYASDRAIVPLADNDVDKDVRRFASDQPQARYAFDDVHWIVYRRDLKCIHLLPPLPSLADNPLRILPRRHRTFTPKRSRKKTATQSSQL